jgi:exoribonuclease II
MELKVTQCNVGRYNLLGNEKSLSFYMGIYHDSKPIEVNGAKAILHYSGEENELSDFEDAINNLSYVIEKCLSYAERVISTVDYEAQCFAFIKVYNDNFNEINENQKIKERNNLQAKIQRLQKELDGICDLPDDLYWFVNNFIKLKIKKYKKWQEPYVKELADIKEGTEKYAAVSKQISDYQQKIDTLTTKLIPEPTPQ